MRVLFVNKFWKPVGGVEEHCGNLVDLLESEGHEVVRFGMWDDENNPPLPRRQTVSPVTFRGGGPRERFRAVSRATIGLDTRRAIRGLLRQDDFDLAHIVHAYHQLGMTFIPLLRRAGIPILLDLHDYKVGCPRYIFFDDKAGRQCTVCTDRRGAWTWAPSLKGCWNGSRASGLILTAEAASSRVAHAYTAADFVAVRNSLQAEAAQRVGVSAERIRVIPNWVADEQQGAPFKRGDHLLFVGRLVREKGVDTLIRAAAQCGVAVRILGDGAMRAELESLIADLGADVTIVGWRSHDEVLDELRSARGLVVPSIWPEVFALVICEAFAAGVPVIGSDIGGTSDLLAQERGYLYPPGDVDALAGLLRRVLDDPAAANARAARAHSYARRNLSYEKWRTQYKEIYQLLQEAPQSHGRD